VNFNFETVNNVRASGIGDGSAKKRAMFLFRVPNNLVSIYNCTNKQKLDVDVQELSEKEPKIKKKMEKVPRP
jgi:hypothetical protein